MLQGGRGSVRFVSVCVLSGSCGSVRDSHGSHISVGDCGSGDGDDDDNKGGDGCGDDITGGDGGGGGGGGDGDGVC